MGGRKPYTIVCTQDQPLYWYIIYMYCELGIWKIYNMVGTQDQPLNTGMYNMDVLCTWWWENLYYRWYTRSTIVLVNNEYMYCVLGGGKTYTMVGTQDQPLYWYNMDVLCTRWWENLYYGWYSRSTWNNG